MKIFLIPFPYIVEKIFFLFKNIRNKCLITKTNLYFYHDLKTDQIFPSKVCHLQYNQRFYLDREMGNIRTCNETSLQKCIKFRFPGQYLFWNVSSCLKIKNHLGRNVLIEISNVCIKNLNFLSCTLPFLDVIKLRRFKTH